VDRKQRDRLSTGAVVGGGDGLVAVLQLGGNGQVELEFAGEDLAGIGDRRRPVANLDLAAPADRCGLQRLPLHPRVVGFWHSVPVFYDPEKPSEAVLVREYPDSILLMVCGAGLLTLTAVILAHSSLSAH